MSCNHSSAVCQRGTSACMSQCSRKLSQCCQAGCTLIIAAPAAALLTALYCVASSPLHSQADAAACWSRAPSARADAESLFSSSRPYPRKAPDWLIASALIRYIPRNIPQGAHSYLCRAARPAPVVRHQPPQQPGSTGIGLVAGGAVARVGLGRAVAAAGGGTVAAA